MAFSNKDLRIGDLLVNKEHDVNEVYLYLGRYVERTGDFTSGRLYMYITSLRILRERTEDLQPTALDEFIDSMWERMYLSHFVDLHSFCKGYKKFDERIGHVDLETLSKAFRYNMKAPFKYVQL